MNNDVSARSRFWAKVEPIMDDRGCWEWTASLSTYGYGVFWTGERLIMAHRYSYEIAAGLGLENDLVVDHLCRNRSCVNPAHLEAVSNRENIIRGVGWAARHARKTHCPAGHPYSGANLYIDEGGRRRCATCRPSNGWTQRSNLCKKGLHDLGPVTGKKRKCKPCINAYRRSARAAGATW